MKRTLTKSGKTSSLNSINRESLQRTQDSVMWWTNNSNSRTAANLMEFSYLKPTDSQRRSRRLQTLQATSLRLLRVWSRRWTRWRESQANSLLQSTLHLFHSTIGHQGFRIKSHRASFQKRKVRFPDLAIMTAQLHNKQRKCRSLGRTIETITQSSNTSRK